MNQNLVSKVLNTQKYVKSGNVPKHIVGKRVHALIYGIIYSQKI